MSGRKARALRQAEGVVKAPKVGTPLAERAVPVIRDVGKLPHISGRALAKRIDRSELTGESLGTKTSDATAPGTTGRKG